MKKTFCEKILWVGITPDIWKYLIEEYPNLNIKEIKIKSKIKYDEILQRTPDIGSLKKNPLRVSLTVGIIWIAIYKALNELDYNMSDEKFGEMVIKTSNAFIIKKSCEMKNPFNIKFQKKKILKDKISNEISDSEFNWNTETILGKDKDQYTINYHKCGLCALVKNEQCEKLLPYMCVLDYILFEQMGAVLTRTKTLANGDELCDFHICKKGSKWDKEINKVKEKNQTK